jgi:pyrroloquinoline quinone biosynthesis protein B
VLFDGTFWSDHELRTVREGARSANEMGHLPIGEGSLDLLRDLPARHRIYMHINNTNPILAKDSPQRRMVESAGIAVGEDGMELVL